MTAVDELRAAVADVGRGRCRPAEALRRISTAQVEEILHGRFAGGERRLLTVGLGASPGAASGSVRFSADAVADAVDRDEAVLLAKEETNPEDVHGMQVANGLLTARGGLASHAAVVARGWGIPAVVGAADITFQADGMHIAGVRVTEGEVLSIDGATGEVFLGGLDVQAVETPPELGQLLAWADEVRSGRLQVMANAETADDAALARSFGADGIGLCRTEHLFLADDGLDIVRRAILAEAPDEESKALTELREVQQADLMAVLEAMDGLPVSIRLLDPPLHEFLPDIGELAVREATGRLADGELPLLAAARAWAEHNPMLGLRGVRLGIVRPAIYRMQLEAIVHAVAARRSAGGRPRAEVLVPLTVGGPELEAVRRMLDDVVTRAGEVGRAAGPLLTLASMIETPRAALRAGELAAHVEAFSLGTNDLTQLTYGFSRDDVSARLLPRYLEQGLLPADPFATLDVDGVGELVAIAVERGRAVRPGLHISVCGEHGGDPSSIAAFLAAGVDGVSCSPYRVPVARLAAAQAILDENDMHHTTRHQPRAIGERATDDTYHTDDTDDTDHGGRH